MGLTILADVGEMRSGVPNALRALGATIVVQRLTAVDYRVGTHEVVERKTVADLHRSIATGRLWRQRFSLSEKRPGDRWVATVTRARSR